MPAAKQAGPSILFSFAFSPMKLILSLSGLFVAPIVVLFVCSLASEDQRHYVNCRLSGASLDACMLQIAGR